jgi:hypothetical protein
MDGKSVHPVILGQTVFDVHMYMYPGVCMLQFSSIKTDIFG